MARKNDKYADYVIGGLLLGSLVGTAVGHTMVGAVLGPGVGLVVSMLIYSVDSGGR